MRIVQFMRACTLYIGKATSQNVILFHLIHRDNELLKVIRFANKIKYRMLNDTPIKVLEVKK